MARRARGTILLLLAVAAWLTGCAAGEKRDQTPVTLRIAGSTSMAPLLEELAQAYQARNPSVLIDLRPGDSAVGTAELAAGRADLAAVSWQPADAPPAPGFQAIPVGRDAIAVIVHPRNPTPDITLLQLRALFRGDTLDWAALGGGADTPVILSREDGSATRAAFEAQVMGDDRVTLNALALPSSRAVVDYVASHRAAIGYVSLAWTDERVRILPVEDVAPDQAALRAGAYHLARTLYLVAPRPMPQATQAFVDFVLSPAGQAIVAQRHVALR